MDPIIEKVDVFISGAGPVGLYFALQLHANGHSFYIAEKRNGPTNESRAISLTSRTVETLQHRKIAQHILQESITFHGAQFIINGRKRAQVDANGDTSFPHLTCLPQRKTERIFAKVLGNDKIAWETELISYQQQEDGIEAIVKDLNTGKEKRIHAQYIVGADGTHSAVRKLAKDWSYDGHAMETRFAVGDVIVTGKDAEQVAQARGNICIHSDGIVGLIPVGIDEKGQFIHRSFINLDLYEVTNSKEVTHGIYHGDTVTFRDVQEIVKQRIEPMNVTLQQASHIDIFRINERKADGFRHERAFLIGDAAHCHSPVGGQGLNLGLQDADNLAWKISLVLKGLSSDPEKLLESYSVERSPIVESTMRNTGSATRLGLLKSTIISLIATYIAPIIMSFDSITTPIAQKVMQIDTCIPDESAILFKNKKNSTAKLIKPGQYLRETVPLRKRVVTSSQVIERKSVHDILQSTDNTQHTIIWISTRPSRINPCKMNQDFWSKYAKFVKNTTSIRPIMIEATYHAHQNKLPVYYNIPMNNKQQQQESIFWLEERWDVQNSISKRVGLDQHMWDSKTEPPAAIVIVRPDLYVAYSGLVNSPSDMDDAFKFLASYVNM
ncbi:FAD binding domain-containing protein [Phascolomyces articulosus]|uniref:FAD binding domain-containing protein n=1 Tax=Phascolomyces articulosus TaxID=60185 RepID=A0AAD5JSA5_9FUNG|nr:FAD binding domain-containing protein [Phascolomyces articulosus]